MWESTIALIPCRDDNNDIACRGPKMAAFKSVRRTAMSVVTVLRSAGRYQGAGCHRVAHGAVRNWTRYQRLGNYRRRGLAQSWLCTLARGSKRFLLTAHLTIYAFPFDTQTCSEFHKIRDFSHELWCTNFPLLSPVSERRSKTFQNPFCIEGVGRRHSHPDWIMQEVIHESI